MAPITVPAIAPPLKPSDEDLDGAEETDVVIVGRLVVRRLVVPEEIEDVELIVVEAQ